MTTPPTRALLRATLTTLALGGLTFAGAPTAFAAPGDDGDVKVHQSSTADTNPVNQPRVDCPFRLAALNFDGLSSINYEIFVHPGQPGNQDDPVRTGVVALNDNGDGAAGPINLAVGMYKVEWTWQGKLGAPKSKVFNVISACHNNGNGGPGGGPGGHGKPPHGPVGAGGGGSAQIAAEDTSTFGIGAAIAAGVAGTAGLVLIRRSRRRNDGAA